LSGCADDEIMKEQTEKGERITFSVATPTGSTSKALWDAEPDTETGKLGFNWETDNDLSMNLLHVSAAGIAKNDVTNTTGEMSGHSATGATVTATLTEPEATDQIIGFFPAGKITTGDIGKYLSLPTSLTQKGSTTTHLRNYMYLTGTLTGSELTAGNATMELNHACAVLRFLVKNGTTESLRLTKVEMLATDGQSGVNTRLELATDGTTRPSTPDNVTVQVQDVNNTYNKNYGGHLLAAGESVSVYAHCFPTEITDGQFYFCVTLTSSTNRTKTYVYTTKEAFSTTNIHPDETPKQFKAGHYYTFNLDISNMTRFESYTAWSSDGLTTLNQSNVKSSIKDFLENINTENQNDPVDLHMTSLTLTEENLTGLQEGIEEWSSENSNRKVNLIINEAGNVSLNNKFTYWTSLASISLPQATGQVVLGDLTGCSALSTIDLPQATEVIGGDCSGCLLLTSINLPQAKTVLSFSGCLQLTSDNLRLPEATEVSGFNECPKLTTLTSANFPKATKVGGFYMCYNLERIDLPNVIEFALNGNASYSYSSLSSVNLPNAETIMSGGFQYCTALETINLPKVTTLSANSFKGCTSLKSVTLDALTKVFNNTFSGCTALKTLTFGQPIIEWATDAIPPDISPYVTLTLAAEQKTLHKEETNATKYIITSDSDNYWNSTDYNSKYFTYAQFNAIQKAQ